MPLILYLPYVAYHPHRLAARPMASSRVRHDASGRRVICRRHYRQILEASQAFPAEIALTLDAISFSRLADA